MAIEDAVVLSRLIARDGPTQRATAEYERLRAPRANRAARESFHVSRMARLSTDMAAQARDIALRLAPPSMVLSRIRQMMQFED
jgi:2-polyprenyl-6-methoxyphenol hydroxylase-like FAD-dependent oxidoreductase